MEELKKKVGRPRKNAGETKPQETQTEIPKVVKIEENVSAEVPRETKGEKTVLEFLAEFDDRKALQVPDSILKKFPNMHFVWIRNDEDRISIKEGLGYTLVQAPEISAQRVGIKGKRTLTDDLVRMGDLVLMMCPENYYHAREMKKELDLKKMLRTLKNPAALQSEAQKASKDGVEVSVMEGKITTTRG